jgi:hypothetical protein
VKGLLTDILFLCLALACASYGSAKVCSVPTPTYLSIRTEVDDATCTEIVVAAQEFAGSITVSRSLELRGDSSTATTIEGRVAVTGASVEVTLQDLEVDGGGCLPVAPRCERWRSGHERAGRGSRQRGWRSLPDLQRRLRIRGDGGVVIHHGLGNQMGLLQEPCYPERALRVGIPRNWRQFPEK